MTNPLLNFTTLPQFSLITVDHILPALTSVLKEGKDKIEQLCSIEEPTWFNFAAELENIEERISRVWSPISHLNSVQDSDELRTAYEQGIVLLTEYHSSVGQNSALHEGYKSIKTRNDFNELSTAQQKIITNTLLDFQLSGAELNTEDKAKFTELSLSLAELSNQFSRNLLDATQAWSLLVTNQSLLNGMPDSNLEIAKQLASDNGQEGWLLNLQIPSYLAVMQHVESSLLREQVYRAYSQRASELSDDGQFDNSDLIDKILDCRKQQANLLGFANHAALSLKKKMAESSQEVINFLTELAEHAKPIAKQELADLRKFAKQEYDIDQLEPWDINFYSERLREQQYAFSDEQVKQYFSAPQVFDGMFEIVKRLFDITISKNTQLNIWHKDVSCYDVYQNNDGELIGQFYADIYVRKNKRGGAWMDTCIHRRQLDNNLQIPVAFLTCNFTPPIGEAAALLTHDEVETLFHEFGHTLHHLLTKVDEMGVAGINGVAWDAVELPSQFLENWCWQKQSLSLLAKHYASGEVIPSDLLAKMHDARNFQSGMQTLRQVEFALFDMLIHSDTNKSVQETLDDVRINVAVLTPPNYNRFQNSFSHVFSGGYAAGYYSYKWAEVLSADAFSRFEEEGIFNAQTGSDFLQTILQNGGQKDADQLFIDFRGRKPKIEPLLKQTGIL